MTSSPDAQGAAAMPASIPIAPLPPALSSMWRLCRLGYRHEPRLMVSAFVLVAAGGAPGRAHRALADAARQRRRRASGAADSYGCHRAWRVRDGDVVSPDRQHARAAAIPRQGHDRARVARRQAPGVRHHDRAPRAAGVPRSARHASESSVRPRPHVHVAVLHGRVDSAAWRDDCAAGVDSSRAGAAGRLCDSDGDHVDLATRCRAHGAGARRAVCPPRATSLHHHDDGVAGQGGARHRYRKPTGRRTPRGLGALVQSRVGSQNGNRVVAYARVGRVRRRVRRGGGVRRDCAPRVGWAGAAGARGRSTLVRLHRRDRRRDRIPARLLDGRIAASRVVGRLRGVVCRVGGPSRAERAAEGHPPRRRVVRVSRHLAARARTRVGAPACWRHRGDRR